MWALPLELYFQLTKMARILAIDYGKKRVGIAVTDPLQIICTPLTVLAEDTLLQWLDSYMKSEEVEAIVLGMPLRLNGDYTHITEDVIKMEQTLRDKWPNIRVTTIDERLTSKMAHQSLIDSGVPKQKRKEKGALDSVSASLILQTYLARIK